MHLLVLLAFSPRAHAACVGEPAAATELQQLIERAEIAFGAADLDGFVAASEELRRRIGCAASEVPTPLAASVHRIEGLRRFADRDTDGAGLAFARARGLQPAYRFPEVLIPPGHPAATLYGSVDSDPKLAPVPPPAGATFVFDGQRGLDRPTALPSVAQQVANDGQVTVTAYLWPTDPLWDYAVAEAVAVAPLPEPVPPPATRRRSARGPLLAGGVASAVTSGLLWGVTTFTWVRFRDADDPPPYDQVATLYAVNRGCFVAGVGTSALAAGLLVGGALAEP